MRRFPPLLLALFLLLSGCRDYKDLNKLSIVTGMAFEKGENRLLNVSVEIVDRSSSPKKEGLRTRVVDAAGKDMAEVEKKLCEGLDFEPYYGAMAVVILSGDAPRREIRSWLLNNREVRETVYVVYGAAEKLQTEEDGGIAAYKLRDILEASKAQKPLELYKWEGEK